MIDGHGDDIFRYGDKIKINFSTNIPQKADHSGLLNHLGKIGAVFRNYPEPEPRSVERRLAELHGIDAENVVVTNGATEAIYMLAQAFYGGESTILAPTFREYQDACQVYNHSLQFISSPDAIRPGKDVTWLCNPNNPTGTVYDKGKLLAIIDSHPDTLFVVDQAYELFSVKEVLTVADIRGRKNVVVLQSLTKRFVVPGLRIGYAIGPADILLRLRSLRMPWSVNSIAIEAGLYLLDHAEDYAFNAVGLHDEALRLGSEMTRLGMDVSPTDCNFLLSRLPCGSAGELKSWLVDNHGLLIRDASNFEGLTGSHFRVAAQSPQENDILINALREWTSLHRSHHC